MVLYSITALLITLAQQPPDIWHDPNALALLAIGAAILGVLATIGAAVYTVRQGRTKRKIDYEIVSDTPIVTVDSTVAGKVQVLFNGQPAEETRVIVIKVRNVGNSSIRKEDYFEPLIFEFNTDVISADVLETEPPTLLNTQVRKNFLIIGTQNVQLPPFPLNRRDTLTMTILLKEKSVIRVAGRLDQGTITTHRSSGKNAVETVGLGVVVGVAAEAAIAAVGRVIGVGAVVVEAEEAAVLVVVLAVVVLAVLQAALAGDLLNKSNKN